MYPAMAAPVVGIDGNQVGVHMTYLRADGAGKADFPHRDWQRECRGVVRGGAIRLGSHNPDHELIIAEGIETTLSAMQIFDLPGWSAVSAGGLKSLELPPVVRRVLVAADNDTAGRQTALTAYQRWTGEGREVRVKVPPNAGDDFNDVLARRAT
jgi:DNA primase